MAARWRFPLALGLGFALACNPDTPTTPTTSLEFGEEVVAETSAASLVVTSTGVVATILPAHPGGLVGGIRAINNSGVAVGLATGVVNGQQGQFATRWLNGLPEAMAALPGGSASEANVITDGGLVGGAGTQVVNGVFGGVAMLWDGASAIALPSPANATFGARVSGLNEAGVAVGAGSAPLGDFPLLWKNGSVTSLPFAVPGMTVVSAPALDVNAMEVVIGTAVGQIGGVFRQRGLVWAGGVMNVLPMLPQANDALPTGINDAGKITGTLDGNFEGVNNNRAVVWNNSTSVPVLLPLPADYHSSGAWDINEAGDVAGSAVFGGRPHPVVWLHDGTFIDLGVLGPANGATAFGLNDAGQVLGLDEEFGDESSTYTALIWTLPSSPPGATPIGSSVSVQPVDPATGATPVQLTFGTVTAAGTTTVTSSGQGAPPPDGFKLGTPPVYYELTTTATYTGSITVCFSYAAAAYHNPTNLKLFHGVGGVWTDVTTSHDQASHTICGSTASLSPFILAELRYDFTGFFQPVDNGSVLNLAKAGSSIPVKFNLGSNQGLDILTANSPTTGVVSCGSVPTIDPIEEVASSTSGLHYDAVADQYTYVWKTQSGWKGTCRRFSLVMKDGQVKTALFQFK